ncbi:MAG: DEAD/DEAH box helicase [Actinomycetia bacterium]|nr:DEAD/DEAH box helicase [Actinomycetes bacterium]
MRSVNASNPETFADLGLHPKLLAALTALGYEEPTPIQREAIPLLLNGRDVLGQAATGTGKTAAFALPILHQLPEGRRGGRPAALVLVPTRELCVQVSEALHRYGKGRDARVLPIYGGQPIYRQLRELKNGVDVVVATPGRALDHVQRGTLNLDSVSTVVLDEADEMLDMGFADDLEGILSAAPKKRQTVLFSATMPSRISKIARTYLSEPVRVEIEREQVAAGESPRVKQSAYIVPRSHKPAALGRILDVESPTAALVFCRTRAEVEFLAESLIGRGYRAEALHGGMDQKQRDRVMNRLRSEKADLIVATDVAARGLDIEQLTHVVNYDVPSAPESYVHRIGRVGRGGREGVAITLAEPREHRQLKTIERVTKNKIAVQKVPTVADLHARRLEATRAALEDILIAGDLGHVGVVVESLTDEYDVIEVAMAAVKLAHEAVAGPSDEDEIPEAAASSESDTGRGKDKSRGKGAPSARGGQKDRPRSSSGGTARVYVGAGRTGGVRPQDLVGAIAGETRLTGRDIGAIEITDRFSLVEVPADSVDEVVSALRATRIKGQKVQVRPDRDAPSASRPLSRSSSKPPPKSGGKSSPKSVSKSSSKSSGKAASRPRAGG